jgi:uncharacterized damage-inducible protein DinB
MIVAPTFEYLAAPMPFTPALVPARFGRLPVRDADLDAVTDLPLRLTDLLRALDTARGRTVRLARLVPEAALDWSPAPGAFSCADVLRHLAASERHLFAEVAMGRQSRYAGHGPSLAYGREGVLAYLDRMHAETMALLESLDEVALDRLVTTPTGAHLPVWRWIQLLTEHEAHHRGQLYLMLRLIGVPTPPLFGMTEEQLVATHRQASE